MSGKMNIQIPCSSFAMQPCYLVGEEIKLKKTELIAEKQTLVSKTYFYPCQVFGNTLPVMCRPQ